MNELTRCLVIETAKKHKRVAANDSDRFMQLVRNYYWDHITSNYGVPIQERAFRLWRQFHPEHFDEEGYLNDYEPEIFDIELAISEIVMRALDRMIARSQDLRLDDWGDLHITIATPQMGLPLLT